MLYQYTYKATTAAAEPACAILRGSPSVDYMLACVSDWEASTCEDFKNNLIIGPEHYIK